VRVNRRLVSKYERAAEKNSITGVGLLKQSSRYPHSQPHAPSSRRGGVSHLFRAPGLPLSLSLTNPMREQSPHPISRPRATRTRATVASHREAHSKACIGNSLVPPLFTCTKAVPHQQHRSATWDPPYRGVSHQGGAKYTRISVGARAVLPSSSWSCTKHSGYSYMRSTVMVVVVYTCQQHRGHPLPISPFPSTSKVSVKVGCNSYFTRRNQRSTVWMYSPCPVQTPLSGDSKRQSTRVVGVGLRRKQAVGRTCTKHPRSVRWLDVHPIPPA